MTAKGTLKAQSLCALTIIFEEGHFLVQFGIERLLLSTQRPHSQYIAVSSFL